METKTQNIRVTDANPHSETAAALIRELSAELAVMYPDLRGGDGSGAFKPDDVTVPRAVFVVAWKGDEAVGCGALRPIKAEDAGDENGDSGEVKRMFVRKSERGQGISRAILTALEERARGFGYQTVMLETGVHQVEAIGLYESAGYESIDCYGIYAGEEVSRCYRKKL